MILTIIICAVLFFLLVYENIKKEQRIHSLTKKIKELNDSLPCYYPCFLCKLTNTPCVGRGKCKFINYDK